MNSAVRATTIRCLIYRTSSIGDVILATSTLEALRRLDIPHEVHWVTRAPAFALLQSSYPDYHFYEVSDDESSRKVYEELRKLEHLHFILDLQKSIRSRRFCARLASFHNCSLFSRDRHSITRAKLILGARMRGRSQPAPEKVFQPSFHLYQEMARPMLAAIREFLPDQDFSAIRSLEPHPELDLTEARSNCETAWCKELRIGRWLAIAPGASYVTKKAPIEFYVQVLSQLRELIASANMELGLLYVGSQEDRVDALAISDALDWPYPTINLCGKLSLLQSSVAVSYAKAILSNDSSLGHIAEALGTPSSVIFGPTAEGFGFAPWRAESKAHSAPLGCRPCSKHGQRPCRFGDLGCYREIDVTRVAEHVFALVGRL